MKSKYLQGIKDKVIVEILNDEKVTEGGIIVPDTAKERPVWGEVIAVGPGRISDDGKTIPMSIKVGDKVLYGKYSGTEVNIEGEELLIMRESDVFAIIPK